MHILNSLLILVISTTLLVSSAEIYDGIKNTNVDRVIDLTSQFAQHKISVEFTNTGSQSANDYFISIHQKLAKHLAIIEASDSNGAKLKVTKEDSGKKGYDLYRATLATPLKSKDNAKLNILAVYSHALSPFPTTIAQDERQLVKYIGNHFFYSPYATETQTTNVNVPSPTIEYRSELKPSSVSGNTITYGPYVGTAALSYNEMVIHFENNKPFITATTMVKDIEISHWGNVAVEEAYELRHDGAKLKGFFSRFDFQRSYRGNSNVVTALKQILPTGASDIYYRDEIGNISTSNLKAEEQGLVMDITPRYPLFGGWSIGFYLGYNLPTENYLFTDVNDGSLFVLNLTFASHIDDVTIDELTVRVTLPEGAKEIDFVAPFGVDAQSFETHVTYLDTSGRPVLVLRKYNVVPQHNQYFQVVYRFSNSSLLREPILLIGAYFFLFLFVMLYSRIPLQFGSSKSKLGGRLEGHLVRIKEITEQRGELRAAVETAVSKYVKSKDDKQFQSEKKTAESALNALNNEFNQIQADVDQIAPDYGRRLKDIQKKEEKKSTLQQQLVDLEISYKVKKAMDKPQYDRSKADLEKQFSQLDEEVESAVSDLTENL